MSADRNKAVVRRFFARAVLRLPLGAGRSRLPRGGSIVLCFYPQTEVSALNIKSLIGAAFSPPRP